MVTSTLRARAMAAAIVALAVTMTGLMLAPRSARAETSSVPGATLTYPVNGQNNVDATRAFTWSTIADGQATILVVGTTRFGTDLANSGVLPAGQASYVVPTLPTAVTLYATLLTKVAGAWTRYDAVTFTAALATDRFTYPVDGQTNIDTTRAFTWSTITASQGAILVIGTTKFGTDLVNSGALPAGQSSFLVPTALPTAVTLYATLLTKVAGAWTRYDVATFTAALATDRFTYPVDGQTSIDTTRAFTWSTIPVSQGAILVIGTTKFGTDLAHSGLLPSSQTSYSAPALPAGRTLYATLLTKTNGGFTRFQAIIFTTAGALAHGSLDPSFGTNGQVTVDSGQSTPMSLGFVASTGQSLVAVVVPDGLAGVNSFVTRHSSAGAIDTTFGSGGRVNLPTGMRAYQVLDAGGGNVVVVGVTAPAVGPAQGSELVRLTATGAFDIGFGIGGIVTKLDGGPYSWRSAVVAPDGRIFVAAAVSTGSSSSELEIAAFTSAGAVDGAFGSSGVASTTLGGSADGRVGLARQPNGDLVIDGGVTTPGNPGEAVVARFLATGQPDPSFGNNGVFSRHFGGTSDSLGRIAVAPSGDLVVAGIQFTPTDGAGLIADITSAGALNTSFGSGGVILENPTLNDWDIFQAVAVDANNAIYGLLMHGQGPFNGSLRRYTAAGQPDATFGTAGVVGLSNVIPMDLAIAYHGRPEVALEVPPISASVVAERFLP